MTSNGHFALNSVLFANSLSAYMFWFSGKTSEMNRAKHILSAAKM